MEAMKYFTPIDFEAEKKKLLEGEPDEENKKEIIRKLNLETFDKVLKHVKNESELIRTGHGTHTSRALHDDNPAYKSLRRLEENPNVPNIDTFIEVAKQDFGAPTGEAFEKWFSEAIIEEEVEDG